MLRSIAARRELRYFHGGRVLRCVSKHEGHAVAVLILRDARTRLRLRGTSSACALLRMRTGIAYSTTDNLQPTRTPSFPRRICARGLQLCFTHPESRGGRSAEKRSGACEAPVGHAITRRVRRLRGALRPIARQDARERAYDAGRSPLGAPPWRFWALGPRFRLPHYTGAAQRAPRSQVVVPGGRGPAPPEASGYEPPPQDATPRSAFRIVSRTRPQ
jgi:hypothetical protein